MSFNHALVVDDSKLARITLQRLLQKHNLEVDVAESGVAALEKLKTQKPDIIFMDHLMPELDGFEATQKIKADPATTHIPVIMCTGKEDTDNYDEEARGIGASGTLSKPPQADQLALILAAAQTGENLVQTNPTGEIGIKAGHSANADPGVNSDELKKLLEKVSKLEQTIQSLEQLGDIEDRLTTSETSLTTLQETVINLQDASSEKPLPPELLAESVRDLLSPDIQRQLDSLKAEIPDTDSLKQDIISEIDNKITQQIATTDSPADSESYFDEEALTTKITEDVENTLKTLFEGQLSELEKQISTAMDDAISESRKDLDEQLRNSVNDIKEKIQSAGDDSVRAGQLPEALHNELSELASAAVTSTFESNMKSHLDALAVQLQDSLPTNTQAESGDTDALLNNPDFLTAIEGKLESRLTQTLSTEIAQQLESQAAAESAISDTSAQPDLHTILERLGELDRRHDAMMNRLDAIDATDGSAPAGDGKSSSSGMAMGLTAIIAAIAALAKSFGLF